MDKNYSVQDDEFWNGLKSDILEAEACIKRHEETDMLMYEFSDNLPELRSELEEVIRNIPRLRDMAEGQRNRVHDTKSKANSYDNDDEFVDFPDDIIS